MTTTLRTSSLALSKGSRVEHCAALWAFVFAVFHIVWAAGWYVGLEQEEARKAFHHAWTLVYDLVIAGMCLVGGLTALAIVEPCGRRFRGRLIRPLLWTGTGLLVLRAGAGIVHGAYLTATQQFTISPSLLWEGWFCLGAFLFSLTLSRFRRT
ncbi:MAG TPA: DUF3995 domain-containing protein [Blastocatellia bacterium]|nr:DUF3995 domain-containing protein [Blastocatellia bacterium]